MLKTTSLHVSHSTVPCFLTTCLSPRQWAQYTGTIQHAKGLQDFFVLYKVILLVHHLQVFSIVEHVNEYTYCIHMQVAHNRSKHREYIGLHVFEIQCMSTETHTHTHTHTRTYHSLLEMFPRLSTHTLAQLLKHCMNRTSTELEVCAVSTRIIHTISTLLTTSTLLTGLRCSVDCTKQIEL